MIAARASIKILERVRDGTAVDYAVIRANLQKTPTERLRASHRQREQRSKALPVTPADPVSRGILQESLDILFAIKRLEDELHIR